MKNNNIKPFKFNDQNKQRQRKQELIKNYKKQQEKKEAKKVKPKTQTKKAKIPAYEVQHGTIVYHYKEATRKATGQHYHKPTIAGSSRKIQGRIDRVSEYNKLYSQYEERRVQAQQMGITLDKIDKVDIKYSTNPGIAQGEISALKSFLKKNRFEDNNGRINNKYVIEQYNKSAQKVNEARKETSRSILGKTLTQGGKSIRSGLRYERLTQSSIKTMGGDLSTRMSEYNEERGLTDVQLMNKSKRMTMTANELTGKKKGSLFKKNYLKGLKHQMEDGVITEEQYQELKSKINELSTADLLEWYYREEYSQIGFTYAVDEYSHQVQAEAAAGLVKSLTKFAKKKGVK